MRINCIQEEGYFANCYVIGDEGKPCIIVDFGCVNNRIEKYVERHHGGNIKAILLTHGHFDHIQGLQQIRTPCPIYIHEEDLQCLSSPRYSVSDAFGFKNDTLINTDLLDIRTFIDGEELDFDGVKIKCIHTPFHTRGSSCFLLEEENALFTGDTLFYHSIGRYDLPGSSSSEKRIRESLAKLKVLDPRLRIYPGHDRSSTLQNELENNFYLR